MTNEKKVKEVKEIKIGDRILEGGKGEKPTTPRPEPVEPAKDSSDS